MKCREIHDMLIYYADNSLPEGKREAVEYHLSQCSECSKFHEFLKDSLDYIDKEKSFESDPFLYSRILTKESGSAVHTASRVITILSRFAAAAVIAAAVAGGALLGRLYSSNPADINTLMSEDIELLDDIKQEPLESFLLTLNDQ